MSLQIYFPIKEISEQKIAIGMKYPGIRPISRELGVTFGHLWKVLEGVRRGRAGLVEAYWSKVRTRYGRSA